MWLKEHNPFASVDERLKSISTGITSKNTLTCDSAESVGEVIQERLNDVPFLDAKIKRSDRVVGLDSKVNSVPIGNKDVIVNPTLLFNRLAAIVGREEDVARFFEHELTPYPMSLFKDGLMRKPDKASMKHIILSQGFNVVTCLVKIIDGGALLHKVQWSSNLLYRELATHYVTSVRRRYGKCCVFFDGYKESTTKDHEHTRRSARVSTQILSSQWICL